MNMRHTIERSSRVLNNLLSHHWSRHRQGRQFVDLRFVEQYASTGA